jgi:hypothetical protein
MMHTPETRREVVFMGVGFEIGLALNNTIRGDFALALLALAFALALIVFLPKQRPVLGQACMTYGNGKHVSVDLVPSMDPCPEDEEEE